MTFKSGFVAILGRPNVGKSTFLNHVMGQKIAIMSDKAQTTRNKIMGIYTTDKEQIVFIDTPGIHKPKTALGDFMVESAYSTLRAGRAEERILRWESPSVEPNRNTAGPTARFRLPAWDTDRFGVELSVEGHPEMNACYTLMYRRSPRKRRCTSMNVTE